MPVGGGELPWGGPRSRIRERRHVAIVAMGTPPDLSLNFRKRHCLIDIESQDTDIRNLGESTSSIDRIGRERIVVAGENNDGTAVVAHHLSGALQQVEGLAVIVECVPRQQNNIGPYLSCRSQDLRSEERRVGKECRSRRGPDHRTQKKKHTDKRGMS